MLTFTDFISLRHWFWFVSKRALLLLSMRVFYVLYRESHFTFKHQSVNTHAIRIHKINDQRYLSPLPRKSLLFILLLFQFASLWVNFVDFFIFYLSYLIKRNHLMHSIHTNALPVALDIENSHFRFHYMCASKEELNILTE